MSPQLPWGTVRGRATGVWADGTDEDLNPDLTVLEGLTVTFEPMIEAVVWRGDGGPTVHVPSPVVCQFDDEGHLISPAQGTNEREVRLLASIDEHIEPSPWDWQLSWSLEEIPSTRFQLEAGQDLDLSSIILSSLTPAAPQIFADLLEAAEQLEGVLDVATTASINSSYAVRTLATPAANLVNSATVTEGMVYPAGSATPVPNGPYGITDFVPIQPGQQLTARRVLRVTYFTAAAVYVGFETFGSDVFGDSGQTIAAPDGARLMRFSFELSQLYRAQANYGTSLLPHSDRGPELHSNVGLPAQELTEESTGQTWALDFPAGTLTRTGGADPEPPPEPTVSPRWVLDTRSYEPIIAPTPYPDLFDAVTTATASDIYTLYDALVDAHPGYVTRTQIGTEGSERALPIYRYDFTPGLPPDQRPDPSPIPTVIALTGTHGQETAAIWAAYHLAEQLCNGWADDPMLALLRTNVRLVLVPLVNPWGHDTNSRHNHAGVDINRNFPDGWMLGTPGTTTYGGPAPLSEAESQAVVSVLDAFPDAITAVDFHNFSSAPDRYHFIWGASPSAPFVDISSALIRRVDRAWKPRYAFMDPSPERHIGYVSDAPMGTIARYVHVSRGIPGGVFEICERTHVDGVAQSRFSSDAMTMGYEAWANFILMLTQNLLLPL